MTRWRPVRAGICNVWQYFDEVFVFEQGRLLLRGPNGSGKSKALEVLLPFLLDANLQPARLSTFGSASRTMHWNLMGAGTTSSTRVGYVWLELARDDGERVTLGARLAATRQTTKVDATYFRTGARVGEDVRLTDSDGAPLTVAALRARLEGRGTVFARAQDYRDAVREQLFAGMSADRYDTLVQALLQLRRPKLSEHLDPDALSTLLSGALPPVDELRIAELAEGFERLDQQRIQLAALRDQERLASDLAAAARRYARVAVRDRATALTQATTVLDRQSGILRHGESQLDDSRAVSEAAAAAAAGARVRLAELTGAHALLLDSDAYRAGRSLDDLRARAADARAAATRSTVVAESARVLADDARGSADAAGAAARDARRDVDARLLDVRAEATRLGVGTEEPADDGEYGAPASVGRGDDEPEHWASAVADAAAVVAARSRSRRGQVRYVLEKLAVHEGDVIERHRAEEEATRARSTLEAARTRLATAEQTLVGAVEARVDAVVAWADGLQVVQVDRAVLSDALDRLVASDGRDDSLPDVVGPAVQRTVDDVAADRARVEQRVAQAEAELDRTSGRIAELEGATEVLPGRATWRDPAAAAGGAALWRLVDVRADVDPVELAGIEAALESSGLLDAWVRADGGVVVDGHDLVVGTGALVPTGTGGTLARVLRVDDQTELVPHAVVEAVLDSVVLAPQGEAARAVARVGPDGSWQLGPLHGRWSKGESQYLGAAARERHRQEQLAALRAEAARLTAEHAELVGRVHGLELRMDAVRTEAAALPTDRATRDAEGVVRGAQVEVQSRDADHTTSRQRLDDADRRAARSRAAVEKAAAVERLPLTREALQTLSDQLGELGVGLAGLDREAHRVARDLGAAVRLAETAVRAIKAHDAAGERAADEERAARALEASLAEYDAMHGAEYQAVVARIAELARRIEDVAAAVTRSEKEQADARSRTAVLEERQANARTEHTRALDRRDRAQDGLARVLRTSLAEDAELDLDDGGDPDRVKAALELARSVVRALPAEQASLVAVGTILTEKVHQVAAGLADRALIELDTQDELLVPAALHDGRRTSIRVLGAAITLERTRTAGEITEGEHVLFRRILSGDTRRHLSDRIRDAQHLVDDMNRRLATVRTASDMQVRLRWDVRDDEGDLLGQARKLLLTNPARLSEDDEQALEQFLDRRIAQARAADGALPWAQQLARVFDYTQWHRFRVQLTRNDEEGWKPLTGRLHSALSGGEKAIALHLPLFAALAAHYEATPGAPRLILLDEVFVGIDTTNRGQVFGLLADLDLDLVLTSDHEWCAYGQVEGIAIHALSAGEDDDAVTSTRFVWTGTELVEDPLEPGMLL